MAEVITYVLAVIGAFVLVSLAALIVLAAVARRHRMRQRDSWTDADERAYRLHAEPNGTDQPRPIATCQCGFRVTGPDLGTVLQRITTHLATDH